MERNVNITKSFALVSLGRNMRFELKRMAVWPDTGHRSRTVELEAGSRGGYHGAT